MNELDIFIHILGSRIRGFSVLTPELLSEAIDEAKMAVEVNRKGPTQEITKDMIWGRE